MTWMMSCKSGTAVLLLALSACGPAPQGGPADDPLSECESYGLTSGTVAMDRCLAAPDSAARKLVLDEETYGTF